MSDAAAAGATTVEAMAEHVTPAVEAELEPAAKKAKVYVWWGGRGAPCESVSYVGLCSEG